ncbi:conserved hypothetical protein [Roseovarius sp. EC-HK134]|nr:conserved hypothetical protein [Roseovarius sp. EC-HK134]VVS99975.1 conserved hypothetical protein [Roseovarius sp. EC-SD190]
MARSCGAGSRPLSATSSNAPCMASASVAKRSTTTGAAVPDIRAAGVRCIRVSAKGRQGSEATVPPFATGPIGRGLGWSGRGRSNMAISPTAREATLPASSVKDQTATLFLEGATVMDLATASELAEGPQAQLRPGANDDVVMQRQAEKLAALLDLLGHAEIGLGRRGIARRVIVDQDQGAGVQNQRPLDHLSRIDRHMIDCAGRQKLIGDDAVLAVEVEDMEALDGAANAERAIVHQRVPAADHRILAKVAAEDLAGLEDDGFFLGGHGRLAEMRTPTPPALSGQGQRRAC